MRKIRGREINRRGKEKTQKNRMRHRKRERNTRKNRQIAVRKGYFGGGDKSLRGNFRFCKRTSKQLNVGVAFAITDEKYNCEIFVFLIRGRKSGVRSLIFCLFFAYFLW